jgi:hypothetical protein
MQAFSMSSCKTQLKELNVYFAVKIYSRRGKYNQNFQKSAGIKMKISSLKNMIETSVIFSLNTHLLKQ